MSKEGYYQCLCSKGHLTQYDAYMATGVEFTSCRVCDADIVHQNFVDDSTGQERGRIEFVPISEERCGECGHIKERRYKLP